MSLILGKIIGPLLRQSLPLSLPAVEVRSQESLHSNLSGVPPLFPVLCQSFKLITVHSRSLRQLSLTDSVLTPGANSNPELHDCDPVFADAFMTSCDV